MTNLSVEGVFDSLKESTKKTVATLFPIKGNKRRIELMDPEKTTNLGNPRKKGDPFLERRFNLAGAKSLIGKAGRLGAVGTAIGRNPIGFLIPCHRVVQKSGGLGGYHWNLAIKENLLAFENKKSKNVYK